MAIYKIHTVDGGYIPPFESIKAATENTLEPGMPLYLDPDFKQYRPNSKLEKTTPYICMSSATKEDGEWQEQYGVAINIPILVIRVTDNIVFQDESGNRVRVSDGDNN